MSRRPSCAEHTTDYGLPSISTSQGGNEHAVLMSCVLLQADSSVQPDQHIIQVFHPDLVPNHWQTYILHTITMNVDAACTHGSTAITVTAQPVGINANVWQTAIVSATLDRLQWRLPRQDMQQEPQCQHRQRQPAHQHLSAVRLAGQHAEPCTDGLRSNGNGSGRPAARASQAAAPIASEAPSAAQGHGSGARMQIACCICRRAP